MAYFYQKVNKRSRKDLVRFLQEHDRYHTMNSWNGQRSFANNVKIHRLGLPRDLANKALDLVFDEYNFAWQRQVRLRCVRFKEGQYGEYSIGFNGRSSGYLVLHGKSYSLLDTDPGMFEDCYEWDMGSLRSLVELVQDFDQVCDDIREDLIYYCQDRVPLLGCIA